MAHNAEEWRTLRNEFIEAAAKHDEYETFIERTAQSEDWYSNNCRYLPVGLIRWPYEPWRKCWIFLPDSGENEEPFSTMKTLFSKAWLWLPRVIADEVVDTAEMHLSERPSPPADTALFWARSNYQYWCWLLWFHWLRQWREANPKEVGKPPQKMVLAPFHCSADLIAQWGLDGSDGTIPEWLAPDLESQALKARTPEAAVGMEVRKQSSAADNWFTTAPEDGSRFRFGPIEGNLKQLQRWLGAGSQPTLRNHNGQSWYYIRKLNGRHFEVWCESQKRLAEANQRRLEDEESRNEIE